MRLFCGPSLLPAAGRAFFRRAFPARRFVVEWKEHKGGENVAAFLLVPFFLVRFGLLGLLDSAAIARGAHFAPVQGGERAAYWLYQLSSAAILIAPFFLRIQLAPRIFFLAGAAVYLTGNVLLLVSMVNFAAPSANGVRVKGLYRVSRNPMYLAYFVFFMGCVLLTQAPVLLFAVLLFQVSAHWIILAEERWCAERFGAAYLQYMKNVRRYL